ncbi:MAG TPA: hypothetical protein VM616_11165 [Gammaproteobacteria bacterium]|nr:hypothetical protein [Gammaproteobacteria bacterium]
MIRYKHAALTVSMLLMGGYMFLRFGALVAAGDHDAAFLHATLGFCAVGAATEPGFLLRNVSALISEPLPASKLTSAAYGLALLSAVIWAIL